MGKQRGTEPRPYRQCSQRWGCPPVKDGSRPDHSKTCRAPWAFSLDRGIIGGRRRRETVTAKTKAELRVKIDDLREKRAQGVSVTSTTVGEWLDYWLERVAPETIRPSTLAGYKSKADQYVKPAIGHIRLQKLTAEDVEAMHDWMRTLDKSRRKGSGSGPLSDATIRQAHMVLRSALAEAVTRRRIVYNPAAVVRAPKANSEPHAKLTRKQAKKALKAAASERELCRLTVALVLGLRQGEALGLRWDDYRQDADGRFLLVAEAVQRINGQIVRTGVKSRASRRRVPVPDGAAPIFEAWRKQARDAYIFPGPNGGPCDSRSDWQAWRDALARAGVPTIPLHGARGSAASLLADMGVPDWRIAEILGHGSVRVTQRSYIEGTDAAARAAIGGLVGELLPGVPG